MAETPIHRIFFSSPGDVKLERETARRIVERLQAELGTRARLEPYFWEHEALVATRDYQENIPAMDGFDVVVCILWSRLGSPLDPRRHPRPDGGFFESGTEYEFATALDAHRARGTPELLVFRNRTEPRRPSRPKEAREAVDREIDRLDDFFARYFREGDYYTCAVNSYRTLGEFEDKLSAGLRALLERHVPAASPGARVRRASYSGRPYLGLSAFDFADAPVFCGRTAQVGEVVSAFQLQELEARAGGDEGRRFVLVLGASGSGKSSLARAGVLPMLVQPGVIEGTAAWRRAILRPGEAGGDPFLALAGALLAAEALPELGSDGTDAPTLAGLLRRQSGGAGLLLRQALSQAGAQARHAEELRLRDELRKLEADQRDEDARELRERLAKLAPPPVRLALLCDQLEELFTADLPPETRAAFVECLSSLARSGRCFVLATLRSDFYPRCLEHPTLVELMRGNGSHALASPGPAELGQMIRQPAEVAGLTFERDAASGEALDELLRDAALKDPSALPLLSYTLEQLYERRTGEDVLTLAAYRELGGLEGAIGKRAESVHAALPREAQDAFDGVWRQLVTLGEGGAPVRRHALATALTAGSGAGALVEALVKARLLVADRNAAGERSISVAHEALLRHWPRVTAWVEANREFLRARSRLATRFAEWNERGRSDDYLVPAGPALGEAESLLTGNAQVLEAAEADYVRRSTARARAREQARLRASRRVAAGAVGLSVLAMIGGGIAWRERGIAEEQRVKASGNEQRAIAQEQVALEQKKLAYEQKEEAERNARAAHESQTRAAYLLGIEMLAAGKAREGMTSLAQALVLDPTHTGARDRLYSYHLYSLPKAICRLSVEAPGGVRQRITGARRGPVQRLAMLDARGAPEVRELGTRELVPGPWSSQQALLGAALDDTGRYLLGLGEGGDCRIWAVDEPGAPPALVTGVPPGSLAFSSDGRWLAAGDAEGVVRLWSLPDGRLAHEWTQSRPVESIELDVRTGLLTSSGGELVLFDLAQGRERARVSDPLWSCARAVHSEDGRVLAVRQEATEGPGARFVFLSATDGTPIPGSRVLTPRADVYDFALDADGMHLAVASFASEAVAYGRDDEALDRGYAHDTYPALVRFSPDGRHVLTASSDGTVRVFDEDTAALALEPIHSDGRLEDLSLSWDGRYLLTSTARHARVWDLAVGRALTQPLRLEGRAEDLAFSADGGTLWAASVGSGLHSWDMRTLKAGPVLFAGELVAGRLAGQASRAAVLLTDGLGRLVSLPDGEVLGQPWPGPTSTTGLAFSADGTRLAVLRAGEVVFLDASKGEPAAAPWPLEFQVDDVRLDAHGERAALVSGLGLVLRELESGRVLELEEPGTAVVRYEFSPDGNWLVASAVGLGQSIENPVLVWDLHHLEKKALRIPHGDLVGALAFSPDGRWLATGTKGQIARVWSLADGQPASEPMFHPENIVRRLLFSPDGRRLATACGNQTLRVFDWSEARAVSEVFATGGDTQAWSFSPDGNLLAQLSPLSTQEQEKEALPEYQPMRLVARLFEVAPPPDARIDLLALTEAASALRVSTESEPAALDLRDPSGPREAPRLLREGHVVACDPFEGWKRIETISSDSWFVRSPTHRSISPAFEAEGARWFLDDAVSIVESVGAMPMVPSVRAALACWKRRDLAMRRAALEQGSLSEADAKAEAERLARIPREIGLLVECAARYSDRDGAVCMWLSFEAEEDSALGRAKEWIERAMILAPDDLDVLTQARSIYLQLGERESELAVLDRLCRLAPEVGRYRLWRGHHHMLLGEFERGRAEMAAGVDLAGIPGLERVQALALLGRTDEALAAWIEENERNPEAGADLVTNLYYVAGLMQVGQVEEAVSWYAEIVPQGPMFSSESQLRSAGLPPAVGELLVQALRATLERHPDLAPE